MKLCSLDFKVFNSETLSTTGEHRAEGTRSRCKSSRQTIKICCTITVAPCLATVIRNYIRGCLVPTDFKWHFIFVSCQWTNRPHHNVTDSSTTRMPLSPSNLLLYETGRPSDRVSSLHYTIQYDLPREEYQSSGISIMSVSHQTFKKSWNSCLWFMQPRFCLTTFLRSEHET